MSEAWKEKMRQARCLYSALVLTLLVCLFTPAFSAPINERVYTTPDSHIAGLLNTEVAPEGAYQVDFTLGHVWYGIGERTNILTNAFVDSWVLLGTPAISLGAKQRYCENEMWTCSLLIEGALGVDLTGEKSRIYGGFAQNSVALEIASGSRFLMGIGGSVHSTRSTDSKLRNYSDDFNSWFNLAYDYAFTKDWSLGSGYTGLLSGVLQTHDKTRLDVRRLGFAGGNLFHLRTQYAFSSWAISAGGALMAISSNWSLWPIVEIHWMSKPRL